jgi:hypothetical protein
MKVAGLATPAASWAAVHAAGSRRGRESSSKVRIAHEASSSCRATKLSPSDEKGATGLAPNVPRRTSARSAAAVSAVASAQCS